MTIDKTSKPVGWSKDVGYTFGLRKTFAINLKQAWLFLTSDEGIRLWLGEVDGFRLGKGAVYQTMDGATGEVRVFNPDVNLRLTWQPAGWTKPSTIQIRVIPTGAKTTVSFHHENLAGAQEREQMRLRWEKVMAELENRFNKK